MSYDDREQLRQALLELHYDLLEEDEAQALRAAIKSDAEVAAEWEDILRLTNKLSDAASLQHVDLPSGIFKSPQIDDASRPEDMADATGRQALPPHPDATAKHRDATGAGPAQPMSDRDRQHEVAEPVSGPVEIVRGRWSWAMSSSIAAVAAMLGMLLIGSWYLSRIPQAPAAVIRLQAQRVPSHLATSDHEFRVFTSRIDRASPAGGFPVTPASLSFSVLARETVLFSGTTQTGEEGSARIALPRQLLIPPDAALRVTAESDFGVAEASSIELPLEPTRCVTYLTLDRPVYRPGETIYFRSLTLRRRSLEAGSDLPIRFELLGPDEELVPGAFLEGVTHHGVGNGSFTIPDRATAGNYALLVKSLDGFFPEQRCEFQVRDYRAPRFKRSLQFARPSYAAGETVEVAFSASRVTGEPLTEAAVQVVATSGGRTIYQLTTRTNSLGVCDFAFPLPASLNQEGVQLLVTVEQEGIRETEFAEVPIQVDQVSVHFYPEGGYLVDGIVNRVYFTAHDALGTPVHLEGEITDRDGNRITEVATVRDGMGQFSIRPTSGQQYRFQATDPTEVPIVAELPEVVADLPVIDTESGVFAAGDPIVMLVRDRRERDVLVRMACRGQLVGERSLTLVPGENRIELPLPSDAGGVIRVTILDAQTEPARPLVERLVYRRPSRRIEIDVLDEPKMLVRAPGDSMRLTLQAHDENGDPIAAVLGVSVVDEAVWSLDRRDRPSLKAEFLLLSEVESPEQLENADFYLSDDPQAARSLDLLLGTQGWRRFVDPEPTDSQAEFRDQLVRLFQLDGDSVDSAKQFDNASVVASEWYSYQQSVDEAWRRLMVEVRLLLFGIVSIWFAAFLIHRRVVSSKLATCLLIGSSSLLIYGCGASQEAMVDSPASRASPVAEEAAAVDSEPVPTTPAQRPVAMPAVAPDSAAGSRATGGVPSERETPPKLVDWLDDDKVAWLLRIAERSREISGGTPTETPPAITSGQLRQLMESRGLDAEGLADQLLRELRFPVRQYAHQRPLRTVEASSDWTETLLWQPLLITDESGQASIEFDLPDTKTIFRIRIDGHAEQGRIGSGDAMISTAEARLP